MIVNSVANRIEAVVIADMQAITQIYHICHSFACDALYLIARETKRNVIGDLLRDDRFYHSCYRCLSRCFNC